MPNTDERYEVTVHFRHSGGLNKKLESIRDNLIDEKRRAVPRKVISATFDDGTIFHLLHGVDEDGDDYVDVGYTLPTGFLAVIDDDTYGTLNAFRMYP